MGLDSLMAIELRNRVQQQLEIELPVTTYLENQSLVQLTQQLEEKFLKSNPSQTAGQGVVNAVVHSVPFGYKTTPFLRSQRSRETAKTGKTRGTI